MNEETKGPEAPTSEKPPLREISQEELVQILKAHREWVVSGKKEGEKADLHGANLPQRDLNGANLREANLRDANLQGANLYRTNLQGAHLYGANLQGARLDEANLQEANVQAADLTNVEGLTDEALKGTRNWRLAYYSKEGLVSLGLPPDHNERVQRRELSGYQLRGANLQGADLYRANLQEANLGEANLQVAALNGANLQEADLLGANLQGAWLDGANLQRANLGGANLQGAILFGANLHGANLFDANLEGADLFGANLQEAHLIGSDLSGADLTRANLEKAELSGIKGLAEAKLQNANLEGATGLLGTEFARADVTGARLPEDIREFKTLDTITETSKNARKIFLWMLLGCAYSWLTIATTTDARLLTDSASSPLPIIQTEIPIARFYWAAPFVLVMVYVYLHLYLRMLWKGLAGLPAIFPDGKQLDERAYPWLLNGLVRRHFKRLKEDRPPLVRLEEWTTIFLAWWTVPVTLAAFWLRYLRRHEGWGTGWHVVLILTSVVIGIMFYRSAARTLRGANPTTLRWKTFWRERRTFQAACTALLGVLLSVLSFGAIEGFRDNHALRFFGMLDARGFPPNGAVSGGVEQFVKKWVPLALETLGYSPFADLVEAELSIKPENWTGIGDKAQIAQVKKARLSRMDLRHALAFGAFLVKAGLDEADIQGAVLVDANLQEANLRGANLQWAVLGGANLQGAVLEYANLQGADLAGANLQGANLEYANLQGADLDRANLQGADLFGANLREADLDGANLQGADLDRANLQGADLYEAKLQGAELRYGEGLTQEELDGACGDEKTELPSGMSIKPCPQEKKREKKK